MSELDWLLATQENSKAYFILARRDYEHLRNLLDTWPAEDHPVRRVLAAKLRSGVVCDPDQELDGVVTVGSRVEYRRASSGEIESRLLVYPDTHPMPAGGLSVTDPFGALLLAMIQGQKIQHSAPNGTPFFLQIEKVHPAQEKAISSASVAAD